MTPEQIFELLKKRYGEKTQSLDTENSIPAKIRVAADSVADICEFLKNTGDLDFDQLMCLTGQDLGNNELSAVYHLFSMKRNHSLTLEAVVTRDHPEITSIAAIYRTANWHEREAYDMVGIVFTGHPKLTRMLLPEDWEGFPLRKDYQVADYWHGMPIPKELSNKMR